MQDKLDDFYRNTVEYSTDWFVILEPWEPRDPQALLPNRLLLTRTLQIISGEARIEVNAPRTTLSHSVEPAHNRHSLRDLKHGSPSASKLPFAASCYLQKLRPSWRKYMLKKISIHDVVLGMYISDIEGSWLTHSLWKKRFLVEDEAGLTRLRTSGATECWIDTRHGKDVQSHPGESKPAPRPEPVASHVKKVVAASLGDEMYAAEGILKRSKEAMINLFSEARMGNAINTKEYAPLVSDIVQSLNRNAHALLSLSRLKSADEYTYMHSVSVCALMVSLGKHLGLDESTCQDAGMAGLLHDLGKAAIPLDIINKPGKLTDEEFNIVKSHPAKGHQMLLHSGVDNQQVLDVCRHHHERVDGKGYPDSLSGSQVSLLARMGAVCDVYDAVTSNRPYKNGWDPAESIARMASSEGHFDATVFQTFVKAIGIYPIGSLVRMASGKLGIVIEQHSTKLTAPKVKLFFSTKSGLPFSPRLVDLSQPNVGDKIVARESPENWSFNYLNDLWASPTS